MVLNVTTPGCGMPRQGLGIVSQQFGNSLHPQDTKVMNGVRKVMARACEKESDHVAPSGVPLQSRPATLDSIALTMWGFSSTLSVYAGGTTSIEVGTGTSAPP